MIQRVQSIWLLLAVIFSFLTLKLSFYSGNEVINNQNAYTTLTASSTLPLKILAILVAVASLVLIFLFRNRRLQLRLTLTVLIISILSIVLYFNEIKNFLSNQSSFDVTCIFAFAIPIFLFLAIRGIYKDQKLVKSLDRLR